MAPIRTEFVLKLVAHINRKDWWHCPPTDPSAYEKRGKFLALTFKEAEFWGRRLDRAQRVTITSPLIGDEASIEMELFGHRIPEPNPDTDDVLDWRWDMDANIKQAALAKGYDSVVLLAPKAFVALKKQGKIPRSIELNLLKL